VRPRRGAKQGIRAKKAGTKLRHSVNEVSDRNTHGAARVTEFKKIEPPGTRLVLAGGNCGFRSFFAKTSWLRPASARAF